MRSVLLEAGTVGKDDRSVEADHKLRRRCIAPREEPERDVTWVAQIRIQVSQVDHTPLGLEGPRVGDPTKFGAVGVVVPVRAVAGERDQRWCSANACRPPGADRMSS
jgi:hypothetical protein